MLEQIDKLSEPPVVGRWYLVRTLTYDRFGRGELAWPIIGPKHDDVEFFNFRDQHYHLDVRFLTRRHLRQIGPRWYGGEFGGAFSQPCSGVRNGTLPQPKLARMKCLRLGAEYPYWDRKPVLEINTTYAGQIVQHSKRGWVCPHRKVPLGNQVPDADGIVTCPLHGLRINAVTGKCAGPDPRALP